VGHEVDFTMADFVADLRSATPTAAAEQVTPDKEALRQRLAQLARKLQKDMRDRMESDSQFTDDLMNRLMASTKNLIELRRHRLAAALGRLKGQSPTNKLALRQQRLKHVAVAMNRAAMSLAGEKGNRIKSALGRLEAISWPKRVRDRRDKLAAMMTLLQKEMARHLQARRNGWQNAARALAALDPVKVLDRGYAIVTRGDSGAIVKTVAQLEPGARVNIRVSDGTAGAQVDGKGKKGGRQETLF